MQTRSTEVSLPTDSDKYFDTADNPMKHNLNAAVAGIAVDGNAA